MDDLPGGRKLTRRAQHESVSGPIVGGVILVTLRVLSPNSQA